MPIYHKSPCFKKIERVGQTIITQDFLKDHPITCPKCGLRITNLDVISTIKFVDAITVVKRETKNQAQYEDNASMFLAALKNL